MRQKWIRNREGGLPEPNYRKFKSDGTLANLSYRVLTPDDPHYDRAASSLGPVSAADAQPTYNLASGGNPTTTRQQDGAIANVSYQVLTPDDPHYEG